MLITLTSKEVNWSNKDGQPYLDRDTRAQARVVITTQEHGKQKLSSFQYQTSPVMQWQVGQQYEIDIQTKGKFMNFYLPKTGSAPTITPRATGNVSSPVASGFTAKDREMLNAIYEKVCLPKEEA